jgi:uncharacterized membrane protein YraQ (UPF0718 family)
MTTELKPIATGSIPAGGACCAPAAAEGVGGVNEPATQSPPKWRGRLMYAVPLAALASLAALWAAPGAGAEGLVGEISKNALFVLKNIRQIAPYLILSVGAATWASLSGFSGRIRSVFHRNEKVAVAGAAAIGATIPICSCTVIPLIAGLLGGGVPFGPIMAFWISAPLMSPEKFILTAGVLGTHYAAARLVTAVVLGAGAGYFVSWLGARGHLRDQLHGQALPGGCCAAGEPSSPADAVQRISLKRFGTEAGKMTLFLGKWLTLAFLLEALIVHYVDPAWISAALGGDQPLAIPLATAIGIPLYTSGVAAIPIVQGLLANGMSDGAALAFLIAGPVTTVPAMLAVRSLVKNRLFSIYLGAGITGSLAAGYLFQAFMG